jgi:adenosylcobinamide-phosphate synthase
MLAMDALVLSNTVLGDFSIRALQLIAVLILDKFFALPAAYHPALLFKYFSGQLANRVNRRTANHQKTAGNISLILLVSLALGLTWTLMSFAEFSWFFEFVLLWLMISSKSLIAQTTRIQKSVQQGHKILAREQLQLLCLRDTSSLSTLGIVKATLESLPQRLVASYFNPILIFACFGIYPTVAVVTVGCLAQSWNPKLLAYRHFGKDPMLLNKLISTPCSLLISLNILILFGSANSLSVILNQAKLWHSFGNGLILSTTALALNCQLGGAVIYDKIKIRRPTIGQNQQPSIGHVADIYQICRQVCYSWLLLLFVALAASLTLNTIK